ncbi:hypothetical protein CHS0354_011547 [Potamilus streckersoni]|uniref:Uncharacterized protein n=1 Tax=Potamilus streckersoni TaxID=2493646 RepID=A0AAE0VX85_9BIVA|nr:hypothetical protein CHS0354_011547 [Potamilus streckersoni]
MDAPMIPEPTTPSQLVSNTTTGATQKQEIKMEWRKVNITMPPRTPLPPTLEVKHPQRRHLPALLPRHQLHSAGQYPIAAENHVNKGKTQVIKKKSKVADSTEADNLDVTHLHKLFFYIKKRPWILVLQGTSSNKSKIQRGDHS